MQSETKTARSQRTRAALVAALNERLTRNGGFTADEIAELAGCTPATFWSHFGTKDDAIAAAFSAALEDLIEVVSALFGEEPGDLRRTSRAERLRWSERTIDELLSYFSSRALLYRAAIARIPESREIRKIYRRTEKRTIEIVAAGIGPKRPPEDAIAIVAFCQGLNNPGS